MSLGIKHPEISNQPEISDTAGPHRMEMDKVVFVGVFSLGGLDRQFQGEAESAGRLVGSAKIEPMDAGVGIKGRDRGVRQFVVAMKFTKGMERAIRDRGQPMMWLKVRGAFLADATGTKSTQTGRYQSRRHSPLAEQTRRWYGQSRAQSENEQVAASSERQTMYEASPPRLVGRGFTFRPVKSSVT